AVSDSAEAATALAQPRREVLPAAVIPGLSRLSGPAGCVSGRFAVRITGRQMRSATLSVDGRRVKRLSDTTGRGTKFTFRIDPKRYRYGVHRVAVRVAYAADSQTAARTLPMSFQRCRRVVIAP